MNISPAKSVQGTVNLPGDKSISHRAAIIAAMAVGDTRIENFSTAADCQTTVGCLKQLGVPISQNGAELIITGVGKTGFRAPEQPLDCGNSGTTMRLLAGVLAGQNFESILTGDESLQKRPMRRVMDPLEIMGPRLSSNDGKPPLTISGSSPLRAIEHMLQIASAQIKSCILLAGLNAEGETRVIEATQTRDHTERMLEWFGVEVKTKQSRSATKIAVSGASRLTAHDLSIPSDISSAAFFIVAAACMQGSNILLPNVCLNPTRTAILDLLVRLGANVEIVAGVEICNEPVGTIKVRGGLGPHDNKVILDGPLIAGLIDELPIIAVLGTQLEGGIEVRDASELRVKETDRIAVMTENLCRMGADVTEFEDGFKVERSRLKGAAIDSLGDHRIAMAFAVAGLLAEGDTEIVGAECSDISFPGFFETLSSVIIY